MSTTDPFASLEELKARLDWELDADEIRIAASSLIDASDEARYYGKDWDTTTAPRLVKTLVLKACKRYMDNPKGYTLSRAGDETLGWHDEANKGEVHFTDDEKKLLADLAGKSKGGLYSVEVKVWNTTLPEAGGYVPVANSTEKPFPMFDDPVSPW